MVVKKNREGALVHSIVAKQGCKLGLKILEYQVEPHPQSQCSGKGQLISKCLFGVFNSPKNERKKFDFTTMIPQIDLFSLVFWVKLKTPKKHFKINFC